METAMRAFEMTGSIDENQQLRLDEPLPFAGPARVRVIVLYPSDDDWNEAAWLQAASAIRLSRR